MLGAIIGDIAGSRFEWAPHKNKEFELLTHQCRFTDDSVMTFAVAQSLLDCHGIFSPFSKLLIQNMQSLGRLYPDAGYGGNFRKWIWSDTPHPYMSYGNGSAMRISPVAWVAKTEDEVKQLSLTASSVTHNHPEGIKGAEAVAMSIWLALQGKSIFEIRDYVESNYYDLNFTLDSIRPDYHFDVSCQGSVPQALMAFFESSDFEDAIRNAVSLGGDSDTQAAIAGSIAEAYYGIPSSLRKHALTFLDDRQLKLLTDFESEYGISIEKKSDGSSIRSITFTNDRMKNVEQNSMLNAVDATEKAAQKSSG